MTQATKTPVLSAAARTTLRYWTPGDDLAESLGDDDAAHIAAAYDGMPECIDLGLLRHECSARHDTYRPTNRGLALLDAWPINDHPV